MLWQILTCLRTILFVDFLEIIIAAVFVCSRLIRSMIKTTGKTTFKLMVRFPIIFGVQDIFQHVFYV